MPAKAGIHLVERKMDSRQRSRFAASGMTPVLFNRIMLWFRKATQFIHFLRYKMRSRFDLCCEMPELLPSTLLPPDDAPESLLRRRILRRPQPAGFDAYAGAALSLARGREKDAGKDIRKKEPPKRARPERKPRAPRLLMIDPGHGGHDPGAIGKSGLQEKDVTLDIARHMTRP